MAQPWPGQGMLGLCAETGIDGWEKQMFPRDYVEMRQVTSRPFSKPFDGE